MSLSFINELYDHLQRHPGNVSILELLIHAWRENGDEGEQGWAQLLLPEKVLTTKIPRKCSRPRFRARPN